MSTSSLTFQRLTIALILATLLNANAPPVDVGQSEIRLAFQFIRDDALSVISEQELAKSCIAKMYERAGVSSESGDKTLPVDLSLALQSFDQLRQRYISKIEEIDFAKSCIDGMVKTTNQPGEFFDLSILKRTLSPSNGGIEVSVTLESGVPKVVSVDNDGPAGGILQAGDFILSIDHVSTKNLPLDEIIKRFRGEVSSHIVLNIKRNDEAPFDVSLVRVAHRLPEAKFRIINNFGVIGIKAFASQISKQVEAILKQNSKSLRGYVIDLRENPGGRLDEALSVADLLISKGTIASQRGRRPQDVETYQAKSDDKAPGLPVVVLADHFTGSGAEMVAAALRQDRGAKIVGTQTAGLGTIQTLIGLSERSALRFTTGRIYLADGRPLEPQGVIPDVSLDAKVVDTDAAVEKALNVLESAVAH